MNDETRDGNCNRTEVVGKRFNVNVYRKEQSVKHTKMINEFALKHDLRREEYHDKGKTVLLLAPEGDVGIEPEMVIKYVDQHLKEVRRGIINNCLNVAKRAIKDGIASGRVSSRSGTKDFVGWGDHCVNYSDFKNGSFLSLDLSASDNIDKNQGDFDILAIRSGSLREMLGMLNDLYGGRWKKYKK